MRFETIMIDANKDVIPDENGKLHYTVGGDKLFFTERDGYYSAGLIRDFKDVLKKRPYLGEKLYENFIKTKATKAINKLTVN